MKTTTCILRTRGINQNPEPAELMDAFRRFFLSVALLLIGLTTQSSAAPVNDNFANAIQLTGLNTSTSGSNVGATSEPNEPPHANFAASKSVWWKWTPPLPRTAVEINTIGSSFDTLLAVYVQFGQGVSGLFRVASDDESGGNHTSKLRLITSSQPDQIYYIAVDGFLGASGNISLNFVPDPPPPNDNFASAILISGLTNSVAGHNTNATTEVGEPLHSGNQYGRSVWWRWTAPTNWVVLLDRSGSSFSPLLDVYRGTSVSSLTPVASSSDGRLTFLAQTGMTYRISADGSYGDFGRITLNLRASPPPANDAFAGALNIVGLTNTVTGDNTFATRETSEPNHAGSTVGQSVWWRWTAVTNWLLELDTSGSAFATALAVYTGNSVSTLTHVASTTTGQLVFRPQLGVSYRIAVDSLSTSSGSVSLALLAIRPPTNDTFAAAAKISGTNIFRSGLLFGATLQPGEPTNGTDTASVWYQWPAPRSGRVILICDAYVRAFTGLQVSNLKLVSRAVPAFQSREVFEADSGTIYYLGVSGSQADEQPFSLKIVYAPLNDDFADALPLVGLFNRVEGSTIGGSLEAGEPQIRDATGESSVWWTYSPPAAGNLEFTEAGAGQLPPIWVYEGASVSNLTLLAKNYVPTTDRHVDCRFSCNVFPGHTYYIAATAYYIGGTETETNFVFDMALKTPAPNDAFGARMAIEPSARVTFSSTVGGSLEAGEPGPGSNSVWWAWTPMQPGPVILTTYGSACDTILSVYVGNSLTSLSAVASNNDGYTWKSNTPAADWTSINGPTNDVISRVRLNADNGVQYKIAVSVAPTNQPAGEVTLNITKLVIDDITAASRTARPDGSTDFSVNLRLANLANTSSSRLRLRLTAHAGYSFDHTLNYNCPWEDFTVPDTNLGTVLLPGSGILSAGGTTQIIVSGTSPPPARPASNWGYGYGVIGILEEEQGSTWAVQDARLILVGEWPQISGSSGPGAGVILVSAALQGGNQVGFLDVYVGPPAAVRLGGAWRVSPTNYGELGELRPYTNYTSSNLRLAIRSTNFSMDTRPLNGFSSPSNQSVVIQPAAIARLDLAYSVFPPLLTFNRLRGLGIIGTPQTTYRVLQVTNVPASTWFTYTNVTLGSGTNWLSQTTNTFSNRFYRALWLSN